MARITETSTTETNHAYNIYHLRNLLTGGKKIAKMIWLVSVEMPRDGKEDDEYDAGTTILDLGNVSSYTCRD